MTALVLSSLLMVFQWLWSWFKWKYNKDISSFWRAYQNHGQLSVKCHQVDKYVTQRIICYICIHLLPNYHVCDSEYLFNTSIFFLEIQMKFCDTKSNISLKIWIKRNSMLFDVLSKFTCKIDFEESYKPKHCYSVIH